MAADDTDLGVGHLALRFHFVAAQLFNRFGDMQLTFEMGLRQQPTVGVERQLAADGDAAVFNKILAFTFFAKAIVFESDE